MTYFEALILTLIVPIVGGISSVHFVDATIDPKSNMVLHRFVSIGLELMFVVSPCVVLATFEFLSLTSAFCIALACMALFGIVLGILKGNDVETFQVVAIIAVLLPHSVVSVSSAYDAYQRRNSGAEIQNSKTDVTNQQ